MEIINLSKNEAIWILLCKGWILKKYPVVNENGLAINKSISFLNYIKPYFAEVYSWTADDFEEDFLRCIFNVLFDIFMKIRMDENNNSDLKDIISRTAIKTYVDNEENPIIRCILAIKSKIAITLVINENKTKRFYLDQAMGLFVTTSSEL